MKRRYSLPLALLLIAALAAACAPAAMSSEPMIERALVAGDSAGYPMEAPAAAAPPVMEGEGFTEESAILATNGDRIVIQNGNMTVVVTDPAQAAENIRTIAETMGGFVVNLNLYQSFSASRASPPTRRRSPSACRPSA